MWTIGFVGQSFRDANFDAKVVNGSQPTARGRPLHIYQFMRIVICKCISLLARFASSLLRDKQVCEIFGGYFK